MLTQPRRMAPQTRRMVTQTRRMDPQTRRMDPQTRRMLPQPRRMVPQTRRTLPQPRRMLADLSRMGAEESQEVFHRDGVAGGGRLRPPPAGRDHPHRAGGSKTRRGASKVVGWPGLEPLNLPTFLQGFPVSVRGSCCV